MHHIHPLVSLYNTAQSSNHRYPVILSGNEDWCLNTVNIILKLLGHDQVLSVDINIENIQNTTSPHATEFLGFEYRHVVFNMRQDFSADAFGAISGTVVGGGFMILLTPPLEQFSEFFSSSHFMQRLLNRIKHNRNGTIFEQNKSDLPKFITDQLPYKRNKIQTTEDQQLAITAIIKVVKGHRKRPLVITSDRGRGKTTALGLAAIQLFQQTHVKNIIITAPKSNATSSLFEVAKIKWPEANHQTNKITHQHQTLTFIAPDVLLKTQPTCNLLMIDEAAAIPTSQLTQLLKTYSRIIFSTTLHGYEGTGRGFSIRLKKQLNALTPNWSELKLNTPIRWSDNDPLEHFVFDLLLLNATPINQKALNKVADDLLETRLVSRHKLLEDNQLLSELFGLLSLAHYRTSPNDLKNLLDNPQFDIWATFYQQHIIAAAIVCKEGPIDNKLANAVWLGKRRIKGNLLPQSLTFNLCLQAATKLKYARIIRITVHPDKQLQGLGCKLIHHLIHHYQKKSVDIIGASFGLTEELLNFWLKNQFSSVHVGTKKEASSGEHSLLIIKPLSNTGTTLFNQAEEIFSEHFPHQLAYELKDLEPAVVTKLIRLMSNNNNSPSQQEWSQIVTFSHGLQSFDYFRILLKKTALYILSQPSKFPQIKNHQSDLLVLFLMQDNEPAEITSHMGKKQIIQQLRKIFQLALQAINDDKINNLINELR